MMFFLMLSVLYLMERDSRQRIITGVIMAIWFAIHAKDIIFIIVTGSRDFTASVWRLYNILDLVAVPTCVFFIKEVIHSGWVNRRNVLMHSVPFLLLIAAYMVFPVPAMFYAGIYYVLAYAVYNVVHLIIDVKRYRILLRERYSNTEKMDARWLRAILVIFPLMIFPWVATCFRDDIEQENIYGMASVLFWACQCYFFSRHEVAENLYKEIGEDSACSDENEMEKEACVCEPTAFADFQKKLEVAFVRDKLYLNPKLTLNDLAQTLGTNRTYISNYINQTLHTNFYDYVNGFRLRHSEELLGNAEMSIESIAEMSGFNSLSTFRRSFTKCYGCSPGVFRQRKTANR